MNLQLHSTTHITPKDIWQTLPTFLCCIFYTKFALRSIPPALSAFYRYEQDFRGVMSNAWVWERAGRLVSFSLPFFQLVCFFSYTLFLPISLPVCFLSLSLSSLFSLALCLPDLYFTLPLLPRLLPETNSLATSCSPRKVDSLSVVPQQPNATSDREACYIINQKKPRGAVEDQIEESETERMRVRKREEREGGGVEGVSLSCWLLQCKLQRGTRTSSFKWICMTRHAWPYT